MLKITITNTAKEELWTSRRTGVEELSASWNEDRAAHGRTLDLEMSEIQEVP